MNRLCTGILELSNAWVTLLDTLGIRYKIIDFEADLSTSYSCLIINRQPDSDQEQKIGNYLSQNGSVMLTGKVRSSLFSNSESDRKIRSYIPSIFHDTITSYSSSAGHLIHWDGHPEHEFANTSYKRKRFYFRPLMHPDELVNSVDKNALLVTLERIISELHFSRSLPFIKKWHSPSEKPVFGFRIDSDYGNQQSITNLYQLSQEFNLPFTWFLHVQAHEEWLSVFKEFQNQEIALHGFEHGTSDSYEHIHNNIERGFQKMSEAGLQPKGFCVPYGIWNDALGDVLQQFDFEYSSEFTLGYDSLPFHPIHKNELHPTLQVPIHPICTGSLNRKSADESDMLEYFVGVLTDKLTARQPVFFYHHPMQIGLTVWKQLFATIRESDLIPITFLEYARFWKQRNEAVIEAFFDAQNGILKVDSSDNAVFIQIAFSADKYRLIPASKTNKPLHSVKEYDWVDPVIYTREQDQELKKGRMQLIKTSLFDWRNRNSL
jgi:hypothetical protein